MDTKQWYCPQNQGEGQAYSDSPAKGFFYYGETFTTKDRSEAKITVGMGCWSTGVMKTESFGIQNKFTIIV